MGRNSLTKRQIFQGMRKLWAEIRLFKDTRPLGIDGGMILEKDNLEKMRKKLVLA
jgi:hypothetical protein